MSELNVPYVVEVPSNWGGSGRNQGRHKIDEELKKKQVYIMVPRFQIKLLGGESTVKQIMRDAVATALEAIEGKREKKEA